MRPFFVRCAVPCLACCILLFDSCGKKHEIQSTTSTLDYSSVTTETATDSAFDYGESLSIKGMIVTGDRIVCLNGGKDSLCFTVSADELRTEKTFFRRGNAGNEFVAPLLVDGGEEGFFYIVDNGKKRLAKVDATNGTITEKHPLEMTDAMNAPSMLGNTQLAYLSFTPRAVQLCLYDLTNQERTDTLSLADGSADGEYALGTHEQYAVVAFMAEHKLLVAELSADKSRIERTHVLYANEEYEVGERAFYTDVVCTEKGILLLSQAEVDLETTEGHSTLEVLDYSGKVIRVVALPFIADKMAATGGRLFLTSPIDNRLHFVEIP